MIYTIELRIKVKIIDTLDIMELAENIKDWVHDNIEEEFSPWGRLIRQISVLDSTYEVKEENAE